MNTLLLNSAVVLGWVSALLTIFLLFRFHWAKGGPLLWAVKSFTAALAPFLAIAGLVCAITGISTGSFFAILPGIYSLVVYVTYILLVSSPPDPSYGFEQAFGAGWENKLSVDQKSRFLQKPIFWIPASTKYVFQQNIPFCTIPGSQRELLCDLWFPAEGVTPSGLAFIYLYGSAWYLFDKDLGTRPFFSHLASQGHVVMDVAYRLFPETDMTGMVHDAKRAIAYMKDNATKYQVDPDRIVIGGGSAGGHLALLAAYQPDEQKLNPPELPYADLTVSAVVMLYAPSNLEAQYYHTGQDITTRPKPGKSKKASGEMPRWVRKMMGESYHRFGFDKPAADAGAFASMFGCHPDECPEIYDFFSPVTHVKHSCPPTMIIHGEQDMFTPVAAANKLCARLKEENVPVVMQLLPYTDHGFDLFLPRISPAAHTAFYNVERFLALMSKPPEEELSHFNQLSENGNSNIGTYHKETAGAEQGP